MNPLHEQRPHDALTPSYKRCLKCGETKPPDSFLARYDARRGKKYRHSPCISCEAQYRLANRERILCRQRIQAVAYRIKTKENRREYNRAYYLREREKRAKYNREWAKRNPSRRISYFIKRKTRKSGVVTDEQWTAIKSLYSNRCAYCGKKGRLTQDHIIPLSFNGSHETSNIVPACQPCNSAKGTRPPVLLQLHLLQ